MQPFVTLTLSKIHTMSSKHHKFLDCCELPDILYIYLYSFLLLRCPDPKAINNPDVALQQLQQTISVTASLISVTQFLEVSLCFYKTLVCHARIFCISTTTTPTLCWGDVPGLIFSLLQLFSTSAVHLKFSSVSSALRSS